jgi:hypothetical protein
MPAASKEAFEQEWLLDAPFMARQTGLLEGALCVRILESDQVQFINVAKWDSQTSLDAARKAVMEMRHRENRNQEAAFETLGVTWSAQDYDVEIPYIEGWTVER